MNTIVKFAVLVITAGLVVGTTSMVTSVTASVDPASNGLERADDNVHANALQNDVTFHEGLCQGGHTTEALEGLGGCDILGDPGNSDENRQDNDDDDDDDDEE
jgi:hypothetical protein